MSLRTAGIALGSNVGDRAAHLDGAVRAIEATEGLVLLRRSRWIETEPVGGPPGQRRFLNGALLVETRLPGEELLRVLERIERKHGRDRSEEGERWGPRTLDLDLLFLGDERIDAAPRLVVPHPRLEERRFVLEPLAELCPGRVLPSGATVGERLEALRASSS